MTTQRKFITLLGDAGEQRRRNVEAERSGGGQVDDEIKLGRLFDGYIGRLCPA